MKQIFWFFFSAIFEWCLSSGNPDVFTKQYREQVGKIQMRVLKSHCETVTELKTLPRQTVFSGFKSTLTQGKDKYRKDSVLQQYTLWAFG